MVDTMSLKVSARQSMLAAVFEKQNELPRTELLLTICFKALAEALAAVQAIFLPIIPMIGASTFKSVSEFQTRNCSTNTTAQICCGCEPCIVSRQSSTAAKSCALQEHSQASYKADDDCRSLQGADRSGMVGNEETIEWVGFAKNKEVEEEEDEEDDNDDDEDDDGDGEEEDGDGEEEEEGGGEEEEEGGEEEEGIEGGPGGGEDDDDDDDDDDDNDNDNGDDDDDDDEDGDEDEDEDDEVKGDQDDEDEDGIVGEDEDDEDGVEDEDDEDDETPEPPQKKRK